ncbi:hypothetical protein C8J57DRAFT_1537654 [Mycena rebaudengoi]|nr:hypothetical protein C8J57DRAFT_1537654 [Mycena rebaudengoi]
MQAIVRRDQDRGISTGLSRSVRWTGAIPAPQAAKTGNAANTELAATGRASARVKRRRTIFTKLKCVATIAEAGVGSSRPLAPNCYAFAMNGSELVLVRVVTMYSKSGGTAGVHAWVPSADNIGALSYLLVQIYQHSYRRQFRMLHRALGTFQFEHLPSNSILALVPEEENLVKVFWDHVEIGRGAQKMFDDLVDEKEALATAVASLNTVRRRGKSNINVMELDEDEEDID